MKNIDHMCVLILYNNVLIVEITEFYRSTTHFTEFPYRVSINFSFLNYKYLH